MLLVDLCYNIWYNKCITYMRERKNLSMESYKMKEKEVTIVTIDTNGLNKDDDIICIMAKRFVIVRKTEELSLKLKDTFKRFYVPAGDLNPDSQKYHKWEKRELIKKASKQESDVFNKKECTELLKFAKNSLIVTNSKDFLRKMIWQFTSHSQAKRISSNRVIGLVEDTKNIIKKEGQFGIINPNLYDIMDYYAVIYEDNHIMNAEFKLKLCTEVFKSMLMCEQKLIKIRFANRINFINIKAIQNFDFEFRYGCENFKKWVADGNIPDILWESVKKNPQYFADMGVAEIPLRMLGINKGYKSSLKGLQDALTALVLNVKGVYFFIRKDTGKLIGVSERKLDLSVGYSGENPIFTDSIIEYIKGIYNYENIRFVPFSI